MTKLCDAISRHLLVEFYYDGGLRRVEPHCYGVSTADNQLLRGYQIAGYSKSGNPAGWRLFDMSKATHLTILNEPFSGPRSGYDRYDDAMKQIFCRI